MCVCAKPEGVKGAFAMAEHAPQHLDYGSGMEWGGGAILKTKAARIFELKAEQDGTRQ